MSVVFVLMFLLCFQKTKYLLWLLAFSGYAFCIYSTLPWLFGRPYEPIWSAILFPLNRTIWALVLTLVVWLCLTNNGTIIGRFLSWTALRPLSRMTYSVYLTHAWVLWIALGTRRELIDPSARSILLLSSGVITASFVIGFFFTILFETPLIHFLEYIKRTWLDKEIIPMTKLTDREKEMTLLAFKAAQLDSQLWSIQLQFTLRFQTATNFYIVFKKHLEVWQLHLKFPTERPHL